MLHLPHNPILLRNIRINMHSRWTHKIPDWHFNVPIICWGRSRSHVQLILLTCVYLPETRRKGWRVRKQNNGKCLINKLKIVSALRVFSLRNSNYYLENQANLFQVSLCNSLQLLVVIWDPNCFSIHSKSNELLQKHGLQLRHLKAQLNSNGLVSIEQLTFGKPIII